MNPWHAEAAGETAMIALGRKIGRVLRESGAVVELEGQLGAGKTTLCKGIIEACGHSGSVKSPTYTLVEPYELDSVQVYHFDLYRLGDPEELEYMGIRDYFDGRSVSLLEWPEKGRGYLPPADIVVTICTHRSDARKVECEARSEKGKLLIERIQASDS